MDAIRYDKQARAGLAGTVTPEPLRQALTEYQECLTEYGVQSTQELPDGLSGGAAVRGDYRPRFFIGLSDRRG